MVSQPKPVAFSYIRFSSEKQADGDSVRRQDELRTNWLARNPGVLLDTSLRMTDKGVSGFTGAHRKNPDRHALAAFLKAVEAGRVPRGSYLIVENLDRLSREHIRPALTLLLNLIDAGVRVVQLIPVEQVYDEHVEPMQLMMAIMELSRGHSESKVKSERIGRAWREKKRLAAEGVPVTPSVPTWLKVRGGKIVVVPERAAVVRRAFAWAAAGWSIVAIARKLNDERVPTFGPAKRWNPSTLHKILRSRSVLGEYQPRKGPRREIDGDPIPGYFPAVVTEAEWWAADAGLRGRCEGGGRTAVRHWNPFSGLLVDARDGEKIYMNAKFRHTPAILIARGRMRGVPGTRYASFHAVPFFEAVLSLLREIDPAEVLPGPDNRAADRTAELEGRYAQLEARIAEVQRELEGGSGEVRAAVGSLRRMEEQLEELDAELSRVRAENPTPLADAWAECRTLLDALKSAPDPEDVRVRLRAAIRRVVEEVRCLFVGRGRTRVAAVQFRFRRGGRRDYLIATRPRHRDTPAECGAPWRAKSFVPAKGGGLDFTNPAHVVALEAKLADPGFDPFAVVGGPGPDPVVLNVGRRAARPGR